MASASPPPPVDYFAADRRSPRQWFAATVAGLWLLQVPWFCGWGVMTQGWLPDGSPKEPLRDFGVEVGITIPPVGVLIACVIRLLGRGRRGLPLLGDVAGLIVAAFALLFVAAAIAGWAHDDVFDRATPHGVP